MGKREKRLKKQEESLLKQAEKHRIKAETEKGRKDTTRRYWLEEAEDYETEAIKRKALRFRKKKEKEN